MKVLRIQNAAKKYKKRRKEFTEELWNFWTDKKFADVYLRIKHRDLLEKFKGKRKRLIKHLKTTGI